MPATLEKTESRESISLNNNGVELFGMLHRPLEVKNSPIVALFHGFASSKHGSNRCYVTLAEQLARAGIAALRVDFRGSGDSEGSLNSTSMDDLVSDGIAMARHAISEIQGIDGTRLGIFGASLGGAIAIETAAHVTTKALSLWAPVASGELWFRDFVAQHPEVMQLPDPKAAMSTYRGIAISPEFRDQFAQLVAYQTLATMPHLPLLHMHGAGDAVVTVAHQEAFKQAAGPEALFITYPEEEHSLGYAKAFPQAVNEIVAFFEDNLA